MGGDGAEKSTGARRSSPMVLVATESISMRENLGRQEAARRLLQMHECYASGKEDA